MMKNTQTVDETFTKHGDPFFSKFWTVVAP